MTSLEVVEHVYHPRLYGKTLFSLVESGGIAVVSTPYYGYLRNLVIALSGKFDAYFTALWDHGNIEYRPMRMLTQLLQEVGFEQVHLRRVGRVPTLAKSMIAIARRPA